MLFSNESGMSLEIKDIENLMDKFEKSSLSEMSVSDSKVSFNFKKNTDALAVDHRGKDTLDTSLLKDILLKNELKEIKNEETNASAKKAEVASDEAVITLEKSEKLEGTYITAPVSGIFYSASKPGEPAFVKEGDAVKKGDVLGLIEAMKVMNELLAPRDGIVEKINITDETFVEYGQELICLKEC